MKRVLILFLILNLLSCKSEVEKKGVSKLPPTIEISTVLQDSISIRALDYGNGKYWFAGSKGKFGFVDSVSDSVTIKQVNIKNDLEFRSLAITPNYTYILTAGNPALVYKIHHDSDNLELVYNEEGDNVFYDSMKFWNDSEGIAMGDPQSGCFSIIKTTNGGKSWQKVKCDNMPNALSGEAAFAASNSNLNVKGNKVWFVTGGSNSRIFHSKDRGLNWDVFSTPIISGEQMTGIYAIDFFDENLGVIIGGDWNNKESKNKNKAITRDGGQTWQLLSNGTGPGYSSDIMFIPDTDGKELLAVGSPGIWWSGNQAKEWTQLSDEGFYTVVMANSTEGYLAGRNRVSKFSLLKQ